jgi:hypothetical protein
LHEQKIPLTEYLLFAFYLVLFAWLVARIGFFRHSGLTGSQLIIVFLLKVMAGIFYGWIGIYYGNLAQMSDTWTYHLYSIQEYHLLQTNPSEYLTNLFHNEYASGYARFFASTDSFWNDLKANIFIKILSVFDVFSFGNYYINVIFYSFITMFGPIAIYRVMADVYPGKKIEALLAIFLIPSFLYWTSGIHKDGLIFMGLALIIYHIYFLLSRKKFTLKNLLGIIFGLLVLITMRNFLLVILVPAVIAWVIAERSGKNGILSFVLVYAVFIIFFFTAKYLNPHLDLPRAVAEKQEDFFKLQGGSAVPMRKLSPTVASFIANAPQALNLSLIRPYPSDVRHLLSLAAATEINLLLLLFIVFLFFHRNRIRSKNFILFCLFFSFSLLLSIGYTVNFLGAIVRYRSIIFPFLLVPMFCAIDWPRIYNLLFYNIKNKNNI